MAEFKSDSLELASFVVSVYVLGYAAGPLLLAPLSEIYGRVPLYHVGNLGFVAFTIGCALAPSLPSLIVFRFLCGTFGSAPLTNGGGTIADMIEQSKRGGAMSAFTIDVMRNFRLLSVQAHTNVHDFMQCIRRLTDEIFPDDVAVRLTARSLKRRY